MTSLPKIPDVEWIRQQPSFNAQGTNMNPAIAVDTHSNTYVAYMTVGVASRQTYMGSADIVVFKLDAEGNTMWVQQQPSFNTTGGDVVYNNSHIAVDSSGNAIIVYQCSATVSGQILTGLINTVVLKMNPD